MSEAQLVFRHEISGLFKMCDVLSFAQQVTNLLRLSPCVVICRNVLYFLLQSSECELIAFLIETLHMCYTAYVLHKLHVLLFCTHAYDTYIV